MRRTVTLLLVALVVISLAVGCGKQSTTKSRLGKVPGTASSGQSAAGKDENKTGEVNKPGQSPVQQGKTPTAPTLVNPTAKDVLERLATTYKSINTLKLRGNIYATLSARGKEQTKTGHIEMSFVRPNKMLLKTSGGNEKSTVASDGKTMYLYADMTQAKIKPGGYAKLYRKIPAPKSISELGKDNGGGINTPALLSGMNIAPYIKTAKLKASEKVGGVDTYVITYPIKTGRKGVTRTETLWIGKNDFLIRQIKTSAQITQSAMGPVPKGMKKPAGSITITQRTVMDMVQPNSPVSEKTFKFSPPPGAKNAATIKPPKQSMPKLAPPPNITGKRAPDFSIPSSEGKQISLSSYRGKNVLLVFWAMKSPKSMQALPEIQKLNKGLKSDSVILSINLDSKSEAANKYAKENGISFPIMISPQKTFNAAMEYGLRDLPSIFVIGKDGSVKGRILGPKSAEELKSEVAKYGIH